MKRGAKTALRYATVLAVANGLAAIAAAPVYADVSNQFLTMAGKGRDIEMSVPLVNGRQALGDVLVRISSVGGLTYEVQSLRQQLEPQLNDEGRKRLLEILGSSTFIDSDSLAAAGFEIRFDQGRLELVIVNIDGRYRPTGVIGMTARDNSDSNLTLIAPANFSAFLNLNGNFDYDEDGAQSPELYVFGAARYKNVVVEIDGALTDQFGDSFTFYRRSLRAVYDLPDRFTRISAGDLRPDTLPLLRTPYLGGIGIERRKQTFGAFLPSPQLSGREIFLDTNSTVQVLVNGTEYQTLQLNAGRYDLAGLPLQFGSNNVQLLVRDAAGRQLIIDYDYFFEPMDLEVGDFEYSLSVGALGRPLLYEPSYGKKIAAVGFYRKALTGSLVLGGGAQVTKDRQIIAVASTFLPQIVPGSFDFQAAYSKGDTSGFSFRGGYRLRSGNDSSTKRQLSLSFDYQGGGYRTLDDLAGSDVSSFTLNANYTQSFSSATYGTAGVSFSKQGGNRPSQTLAYAEVSHRLNNRFRLTAGVEYGKDRIYKNNVGIRVGISALFGGNKRANADYRSRTGTSRATFSSGADNHVGSLGYDVSVNNSQSDTSADASVNYIGNRFTARASVFGRGDGFGNLTERKSARLQMGTAIGFADGMFGVGRQVQDSFALVAPHKSLSANDVITGRTIKGNKYEARSGLFGAALQGTLGSYAKQNIQFDFADGASAYDIGDGVARVNPPFHSGYKIIVGSDRNVSAVGQLVFNGEPVKLGTGTITSTDDKDFGAQPFFTNSVGRFGVIGLAPGKTYLVTLEGEYKMLVMISVPPKSDGLYRMGTVDLQKQGE